ncbi:MAG TPA: hypothetical protein VNR90_09775 [Vicinamibacterales bacterium]|nr:hypothetical protein [Vicinamibacterales bacterium]
MQHDRSPLVVPLLGLALAGLGALAAHAAATAPAAPPTPRLFGAWAINQQLTAELAEHARGDGPSGGHRGGFGHGEHGGGGDPRSGGRPRGGGDGERGEHGDDSGRMSISGLIFSSSADGAVLLTDAAGHERRFEPGAPVKRDPTTPENAEISASWDADGDLVVEIKPEHGPRRTETYIVDHEKKHLYVTTVLTSGFGSRTRTLAFDPVDPATLPAPSAGSPGR